MKAKFWVGEAPLKCDACSGDIIDEFSDCNLRGTWGCFCARCVRKYHVSYGMGLGQRYTKQPDGMWMKTKG